MPKSQNCVYPWLVNPISRKLPYRYACISAKWGIVCLNRRFEIALKCPVIGDWLNRHVVETVVDGKKRIGVSHCIDCGEVAKMYHLSKKCHV